jgi:aspartyl-tRNA(Asn)/glutamyl-tRNA(Gln) amidotransferase subunit C
MPLTHADVQKIGDLARLQLTPEETESFTAQLGAILDYVQKLDEVDAGMVEPMSHSSSQDGNASDRGRDDVIQPSLGQRTALENAPDAGAGYFRVPKVIGG